MSAVCVSELAGEAEEQDSSALACREEMVDFAAALCGQPDP